VSVIVAQGLRKRYDDVEVVAGIDHVVDEGEVVATLGPNDASMTTTIEMVLGLRRPTAEENEYR
jgi:ABC-2 type transport system ATP-binding protein